VPNHRGQAHHDGYAVDRAGSDVADLGTQELSYPAILSTRLAPKHRTRRIGRSVLAEEVVYG
jgi:hypothetical protein